MTEENKVTKKKAATKKVATKKDENRGDILAAMVEIAKNHFAAQSVSNPVELSLMRVQLNLIKKGFDGADVLDLIMSMAKEHGLKV